MRIQLWWSSPCFNIKRVARTQIWLACGLSSWAYLRIYDRAMSLMSVVAAMVPAKISLLRAPPHFQCSSCFFFTLLPKHMLTPLLWTSKPHLFKDHFIAFVFAARKSTQGLMKRNPASLISAYFSHVATKKSHKSPQISVSERVAVLSCALQLYHSWSILGLKEYRKGTKFQSSGSIPIPH